MYTFVLMAMGEVRKLLNAKANDLYQEQVVICTWLIINRSVVIGTFLGVKARIISCLVPQVTAAIRMRGRGEGMKMNEWNLFLKRMPFYTGHISSILLNGTFVFR